MSARERVEARCVEPGRWLVEGWDVERQRAYLGARRYYWLATRGGVDLVGFTLEDICGQIIDHDSLRRDRP